MSFLSIDQKNAIEKIIFWFINEASSKQYISLGGYAGTGKTTLISILRKKLTMTNKNLKVGFASYTGKAARVLKQKLNEQKVIYKQDTVGTIHSLIYSPITNEKEEIVGWKQKEKIDRNLIIIDEASMVDEQIWNHLVSYNIPIIVVGDHGQLPPIQGDFNLMEKPQILLQQIHRQAQDNPIIGLSIQAREYGFVRPGIYSDHVIKYKKNNDETQNIVEEALSNYNSQTLILCGFNHTRQKLNTFIRKSLGFESPFPQSGDRVICLRNNHASHIFNGMLGTIIDIQKHDNDWYETSISLDDEEKQYHGLISIKQFGQKTGLNFTDKRSQIMKGDLFDFGYALTVHKAQGSQAKKVVLFEERFRKMTNDKWRRWLYTAITRAEEELIIF
ncbi:hypothetical protein COY87_04235 [Candidatus Roizmanbacteria bacterium CG_4_10_14_0_8_um_filter_33_9]|uniref:UvrD-like helicase C-terminal domain-containing protein n=1 Tax=Candidatus Roizmanbacteria bacterium CG_4_10_14_0_8_um_filter_33_9 TaxID=1974826 RepID=A0A2M7QHK2_9BACT|nr:MAG: hypothetical protein COY87_04235 [Candidatus Roizmanbacteria bacterium CG_4_10_14_0_8_um_filter_33_9]